VATERLARVGRRRFRIKRLSPACLVLLLTLQIPLGLDAAEKFRAASGGFGTAIQAVLWAAYHKNIFQKCGLDAEYIAIPSGTTGMQILLANEVQALFSGGPQPINANLQGADIAIITGGLDCLPYKLITRPEIKSSKDLKGVVTFGITSFGSVTELATRRRSRNSVSIPARLPSSRRAVV
jgi:ABC-type nitrate/sulfonate/bicarbonate transport system substrate-binding protein